VEYSTLKNAYNSAKSDPSRYLAPREWISWLILSLRFLALTLAVLLSFLDRSQTGIILPIAHVALAAIAYNVVLVVLARYVGWLRQTLNVLVIDTLITTLAVYLTGGYHSGFFIVYFFIVTGAAFYLNLVATTILSLVLGIIYVGACFLNPAGIWTANAVFILGGKVVLLLLVGVLCGLLLEQLRREHYESERERTLSSRLSALNDLFQQLSASLDLQRTLNTVVETSRRLLDADVTVLLLRGDEGTGLEVQASNGLSADVPVEAYPLEAELSGQPFASRTPYVAEDPQGLPAALRQLLRTEHLATLAVVGLVIEEENLGILCAARRSPVAYSEADLAFLQALAQEAALAIRNARLYEREKQQVDRLQTLEALQASFISVVSHELRTPLTCIKTSVDMLEETLHRNLPEVREELLETIGHHTSRLESIVEDLLDATRLEAGQLTLSRQPTDVRLLVDRTTRAFSPMLEKRHQAIELDLPGDLDPVLLDRHRFEQALTNLISNANRFASKGGHIGVRLVDENDLIHLTVSDDGPGIPVDEQEKIFEKFYVVTDGRPQTGVGLGLYITRQLVELHGGRIWVESEPGLGSAFHVTIPKNQADPSSGV
jgi:K+-sensing histidine kinase KdpD